MPAVNQDQKENVLLEKDSNNSFLFYDQYSCTNKAQCQGFSLYSKCRRSSDCEFGNFCNFGHCVPTLAIGSSCNSHEACGREALCVYGDSSTAFGTCTEILSVDADTLIMGKIGTQYRDLDKVCRTYWAKPLNGTCGKAITSSRAGKPCLSDADCTTSDTNSLAKCKCGFSTKGLKYCDIEGGDQQWLDAADAFSSYQDHSLNCHAAEGFGPCHENSLYLDWKCKELKAKLYVYFIDNPTCLGDLMKYHPDFAEYAELCQGVWSIGISIISIIFIVLSLTL
eukprot:403356376